MHTCLHVYMHANLGVHRARLHCFHQSSLVAVPAKTLKQARVKSEDRLNLLVCGVCMSTVQQKQPHFALVALISRYQEHFIPEEKVIRATQSTRAEQMKTKTQNGAGVDAQQRQLCKSVR